MPDPQPANVDRLALEALQWLAKTLGQMSLYKVGHPAVAAALKAAEERLDAALAETSGELAFTVDEGKWIANGRIIGFTNQTPPAMPALLERFKLISITFRAGLTYEELVTFCELAAARPDATQDLSPKAYLEERGVTHIAFNEAVYAKMDAADAPPAQAEPSPPPAAEALASNFEELPLEAAIEALVERAVPDPSARAAIIERVMKLVAEDIARRVNEATLELVAEKTVIRNEAIRTEAVIGDMAEGVVVVDEKGKILMMNPAAEEVYGVTLAQAAGKHLTERAGEEHVVTLASGMALPGDREVKPEIESRGAADTRRTLRASGAVVQNEAGKVVGMVASLPDVAKHKELQRMQRDFVAHVTHELRAPLASIHSALEILQEQFAGTLKPTEDKMMAMALRNTDRLGDMINSILDFSKIESGQMTVNPQPASPEKIAREAVESMSAWTAKKGLSLDLSVAPNLPPVKADERRTVQVLINLLSNAIKFTPKGGRITVGLSPSQEKSGKFVEFFVKDNGPGIAKEDQKKVFEKFVQIAAGEMQTAGTGLGLSIAKALVHLQGGNLWLNSEKGQGATFTFTLPMCAETRVEAPAPRPSPPWWKSLLGGK